MFYLRVKLRFYDLDEKSFFYFTFKIISGVCQDTGIGSVGAVSWVVSEVLSNCRYVCSRCLSMLGHYGINIASGFSNIHLSTRACDFVYHTAVLHSYLVLSVHYDPCIHRPILCALCW